MSRRLSLKAGEISAILHAADHDGDGPVFDLSTEDGSKMAARFQSAIAKLRAKLSRINRESSHARR